MPGRKGCKFIFTQENFYFSSNRTQKLKRSAPTAKNRVGEVLSKKKMYNFPRKQMLCEKFGVTAGGGGSEAYFFLFFNKKSSDGIFFCQI